MRQVVVVLAALFVAAVLAAGVNALPPATTYAQRPTPTAVMSRLTSCTTLLTGTVGADTLRMCDRTTVTVRLGPDCPVCPGGVRVMYLVPVNSRDVPWVRDSSQAAVERMERYPAMAPEVAVIRFDDNNIRLAQRFSTNLREAKGELRVFNTNVPVTIPAYDQVANLAAQTLRDRRKDNWFPNGLARCEIVVLYLEGVRENSRNYDLYIGLVQQAVQTLRGEAVTLMIGCVGDPRGQSCTRERDFPNPQRYFVIPPQVYPMADNMEMALESYVKDQLFLREIDLAQAIPPGLHYVDGSASPPAVTVEPPGVDGASTISWRLPEDDVHKVDQITFTYAITAVSAGVWPIAGTVHLRDKYFFTRDSIAPAMPITVTDDLCLPTPTPTNTPTSTPTSTSTPTLVPSITPTYTPVPPTMTPVPPTATPTPKPQPIYLPIVVREDCADTRSYADVVLVLDVSGSMQRPTRSGRTKLEATQDAAKVFVGLMDLTADAKGRLNQAAVVGFNREAWIEAPLGTDRAGVEAAIDRLSQRSAQFTRLDLAFDRGLEALDPARRKPGNKPVIILLTDGLPDQVPPAEDGKMETTVLRAAAKAKDAGVVVFTIGIGAPEDINPDLLKGCATDPNHYFYTPDPEDLGAIYKAIASDFGCPVSSFWGGRLLLGSPSMPVSPSRTFRRATGRDSQYD